MVTLPNNKFGCSSSCFSFFDRHRPLPRHFSPATTVTAMALLAFLLLLLQTPIALLFSPYLDQDDFLVFASSSASQTDTTSSQSSIAPLHIAQQSLQFLSSGNSTGPSVDNFSLPDGYIIEPFMWNLSLPTSIAVDSNKGSIYVAESIINRYDEVDGVDDNSSGIPLSSGSSPSPVSFVQQQPQVNIVKANIGNNDSSINFNQSSDSSGHEINDQNFTFFNNALDWPVIDMEVDSANGFLYAFHDNTTISSINMTSGEREDIIATDEEQEEGQQQPQDPLPLLIHSSTQMALGGNDEGPQSPGEDERSSNHGSSKPTMLYIPCMNNEDVAGLYGRYCILTLPIDSSDGNAIFDKNSGINNTSSFVLENITSRPAGIAIINSSRSERVSSASSTYSFLSSSSSSSPSPSISEQERPFSITRNQTSNPISDNNNDNHIQLLIISSPQNTSDGTFSNHGGSNNQNEVTSVSYRTSNESTDASAALPFESTIHRAHVFGLVESQDSINSNNNTGNTYGQDNVSNYNNNQLQALSPSIDTLANYPDSQLGKVVVVSVPFATNSSSLDGTIDRNQSSLVYEDNEESISSLSPFSPPLPNTFGLNDTTAFVIDYGLLNSSTLEAPTHLPKIIMLDVQTGNIMPFLTLSQPDSNFMPVDVAFDYINNDLYVLSIGNSPVEKGDITSDIDNQLNPGTGNNENTGVIWKISYQGKGEEEEEETTASINGSSSDNGTDNIIDDSNNGTDDETTSEESTSSSSNDTSTSDNSSSTTEDSSIYEDDDESGEGSSDESSSSSSSEDSDNNSSNTSSEDSDDDSGNGESSTDTSSGSSSSETETSPPPSSSSPEEDSSSPSSQQPSTEPANDPPIAEDDAVTTEQETPVVIDVLANDTDINNGDSVTIDTVDEVSIQGGNVITISDSSNDETGDNENEEGDKDNNNSDEGDSKAKIQYTPAEGFFGIDEFTYSIIDKSGATDSAKVTVSVSEVVVVPHPIRYWLENEDGITGDLLEEAAEENDNSNDWSFKLGNFEVPVEFDVSDSNNDTMGILGAGEGNNNNNNAYDQLAAQLLATKLNIQHAVSVCESVDTTIVDADAILQNIQYDGPSSTENLTGESRDTALEVIEILDEFNNNGCV